MPFEVAGAVMASGLVCLVVRLLFTRFRPRRKNKETLAPAREAGATNQLTATVIFLPVGSAFGIAGRAGNFLCDRCALPVYVSAPAKKFMASNEAELLCCACGRALAPEIPGLMQTIRDLERGFVERN